VVLLSGIGLVVVLDVARVEDIADVCHCGALLRGAGGNKNIEGRGRGLKDVFRHCEDASYIMAIFGTTATSRLIFFSPRMLLGVSLRLLFGDTLWVIGVPC
jgi:hypothetical protein